jgi:hypothetical protein
MFSLVGLREVPAYRPPRAVKTYTFLPVSRPTAPFSV